MPTNRFRPLRRAMAIIAILAALSPAATKAEGRELEGIRISPRPRGPLPAELQAQLRQAVAETMDTFDVPGAAVGVFVPGKGSWVHAAGVANLETSEPVTAEMSWPLRSVTKSFTVTLLLQLADEGRLGLGDTIDRFVRGVPHGREITLRQLANMTSGVAEYTTSRFVEDFLADPDRLFTIDELNAYALEQPAQFLPGARHVYTNTSTNLIGAAIEEAAGRRFSRVLDERILRPLGLLETNYVEVPRQWPRPHPVGYQPGDHGLEPQLTNFSIYGPAGAMVSTLEDQRVWGEILATGRLLSRRAQARRLEGAFPLDGGPEYDRYALGIGQIEGWWGHTGEGFGFTALTMHDAPTGATVVVFMNIAKPSKSGHPPTALFRKIASLIAPGSAPARPAP